MHRQHHLDGRHHQNLRMLTGSHGSTNLQNNTIVERFLQGSEVVSGAPERWPQAGHVHPDADAGPDAAQ